MNNSKTRSPWSWIPTLYFAEGIPYVVAMTVSVIMYKRLGISNTDIALYTSWLYLPWVIKPFWSPFVDLIKTKRWWIVSMQLLIGAGLAGVAFLIPVPFFFQATLAVLWLLAFSSATHDIAADGFYMLALDTGQQSFFVGIRSTFYRLAMIMGQGVLIILAGSLEVATGTEPLKFNVLSSNTTNTEFVKNIPFIRDSNQNKATFIAYPSNLVLSTVNISPEELAEMKNFAKSENEKNGFTLIENTKTTQETDDKSSWWTNQVADPLANFIKRNFGEKKAIDLQLTSGEKVGNAGIIAVTLSKKPDPGKEMVLNSRFSGGDKSISLVSGERLVFNEKNWDKPAYLVVQLDKKLTDEVTGTFTAASGNLPLAWSITFYILAGFFLLVFVYHRFVLPIPASDSPKNHSPSEIVKEFGLTFKSFFSKKGIGLAIAFMLLYRLAEAMLVKLASPFLLDTHEAGGLGLTTGQVGFVYGTVGVVSLTIGGIVGGIVASRQGLKYWIWPMALAITLPNLAYVYLSWFTPDNMFYVNLAVAIEQFGYGFGFTAYMLYLIYFSDGEHKTAHYAICTGFMALGMMLPGMIAGWIQELIGYSHFFIFVMICTIPTLLLIPFLKIDKEFGKKEKVKV
ncbi:MAG: AmpG family muropeptide MFS transporter [Porphyromonadaceae bacterium]|nr:AmpG family muropeptide MFS transporter [Porphyromonadaceae bacterium]